MKKIKVGDWVRGNDLADDQYSITTKGYIGVVISVVGASIIIKGRSGNHFTVLQKCFDKIPAPETGEKVTRKEADMGTVRQKIRELTKSKEDKLFEKHGIVSDRGSLTDLGRRVVMDKLWSDKDLRAAVLADVEAVEAEEAKACKKK